MTATCHSSKPTGVGAAVREARRRAYHVRRRAKARIGGLFSRGGPGGLDAGTAEDVVGGLEKTAAPALAASPAAARSGLGKPPTPKLPVVRDLTLIAPEPLSAEMLAAYKKSLGCQIAVLAEIAAPPASPVDVDTGTPAAPAVENTPSAPAVPPEGHANEDGAPATSSAELTEHRAALDPALESAEVANSSEVPTHGATPVAPDQDAESLDSGDGSAEQRVDSGAAEQRADAEAAASAPQAGELLRERLLGLLDQATTPYVCLVDVEQRLDIKAVREAVTAAQRAKPDYVTATILNRSPLGEATAPEYARTHRRDEELISLEDRAPFLADTEVVNKVYDRRFLQDVVAAARLDVTDWRVGLALQALGAASFLTVLKRPLVTRDHPTESAELRRRRMSLAELERRETVYSSGLETLTGLDSLNLETAWRIHALDALFGDLYALLPRVGEDFWQALHVNVVSVAAPLTDDELLALPIHKRVLTHLVRSGQRDDAERVSNFRSQYGSTYRLRVEGESARVEPHYLGRLESSVPDSLLLPDLSGIALRAQLRRYEWDAEGNLILGGWAYVPGLGPDSGPVSTSLYLVDRNTGGRTACDVVTEHDLTVDLAAADPFTSYADSAFTAVIPRAAFAHGDDDGRDLKREWTVELEIRVGDLVVVGTFQTRDMNGSGAHFAIDELRDGERLVPEFTGADGLLIKVSRPKYVLEDIETSGRDVSLTVSTTTGVVAHRLELDSPASDKIIVARLVDFVEGRAEYRVRIPDLLAGAPRRAEVAWRVRADTRIHGKQLLAWRGRDSDLGARANARLAPELSGFGYVRLSERRHRVLVDGVGITSDGRHLEIRGTCAMDSYRSMQIALVSGRRVVRGSTEIVVVSGSEPMRFTARIPLYEDGWDKRTRPLAADTYSLRVAWGAGSLAGGHWVLFDRRSIGELPLREEYHGGVMRVARTVKNGAVKIDIRPPLALTEESPYGQHSLQAQHFEDLSACASPLSSLQDHVVVMCYGGRKATDTPLEIAERFAEAHPGTPVYWGVTDLSVPTPDWCIPVVIGTQRWYEVLSTARILVNNNNFPYYFRKREGQYYLQTWHGTPLKRLVFDVDRANFALVYWEHMAREARYWDELLAQDAWSAEVLAKAFHYEGEVVAEGYPRNDSLFGRAAAVRRSEVREQLQIDPNTKVALYAPTWRDNAKSSTSQYAMVTYLDFERFAAKMGAGWTVLLRGHHNVAAGRNTTGVDVIDVTEYPEINDLYLAADVLINDYSSVMFDFATTRKPIVFLVPDLEEYSGSVRGFYFDFEHEAPGPLLRTTDEVCSALGNLGLLEKRFRGQYERFVEKFASRDDGSATERVYAAVSSRWTEASICERSTGRGSEAVSTVRDKLVGSGESP